MAVKWITSVSTGVILIRRDPSTSMVWSTKSYWDIHYGIEKGLAPILAFQIVGRVKAGEQYEATPYR